jgi:hypothetical protein
MDVLALAMLAAVVTLLFRAAAQSSFDLVSAFGSLYTGWRGDPWPRGVQEEDRDRPWFRAPPPDHLPAPPRVIPMQRVVRLH